MKKSNSVNTKLRDASGKPIVTRQSCMVDYKGRRVFAEVVDRFVQRAVSVYVYDYVGGGEYLAVNPQDIHMIKTKKELQIYG